MTDLTRWQYLQFAAGIGHILVANREAEADLLKDVPKLLGLAGQLADLAHRIIPPAAAPVAKPADAPSVQPHVHAVASSKVALEVAQDGLTPAEAAMFRRAAEGSG